MKILYNTSAISTGGRDGKVIVENSPLEFEMALPVELGGAKKIGANQELIRFVLIQMRHGATLM